jgi:hypothetical protein
MPRILVFIRHHFSENHGKRAIEDCSISYKCAQTAVEVDEENGAFLLGGERREWKILPHHSPHSFRILQSYVAFKLLLAISC